MERDHAVLGATVERVLSSTKTYFARRSWPAWVRRRPAARGLDSGEWIPR